MTARNWCCLILAALLAGCAGEGNSQSCKVNLIADLPLLPGRHPPAVEATVNNQKVAFLIDTGAQTSMIGEDVADHFGVPLDYDGRHVSVTGVGGTVLAPMATIHHLGLGHGVGRDVSMPVAGKFGKTLDGVPIVGLFGADFMSLYDIDLDIPRHRFKMYRLVECGSNLEPIDAPFFEVPFELERTNIVLDIKLNEKPMRAILDTGAMHTMIPTWEARRIGVGKTDLAADAVAKSTGVDENELDTYVHRFGSLQIGDEQMRNFRFGIADMATDDMLIGDDFLYFNEVWISYPLGRLYIHPATERSIVHVTP